MERGIGYRENANVYVEKIHAIIGMNVPARNMSFIKSCLFFFSEWPSKNEGEEAKEAVSSGRIGRGGITQCLLGHDGDIRRARVRGD